MKINKRSKRPTQHKKTKIVLIFIGVLIGIAVILLISSLVFGWWNPQKTTTTNPNTTESQTTSTDSSSDKSSSEAPTTTTDKIPVDNALSASITSLSQANGSVTFNGSVTGDTTNGNCSLVFENSNAKPVTRTAQSTRADTTSICGPISIPEQEFTYLGTWHLTFRYYTSSGDKQSVATQDIQVD